MVISFIWKFINSVQFFPFQWWLRRILYYTQISIIWFNHTAAADSIIISILHGKTIAVFSFIILNFFERGQNNCVLISFG